LLPFAGLARPDAVQDTDADSVVNPGKDVIPNSGDRLREVPKYLRYAPIS